MINTSNANYLQATIELFGMVITVVLAIMFFIITGNRKKSEKNLFVLMILAGLSLMVDATWYICDGNTSRIGCIFNSISNFMIFICNPTMIMLSAEYLSNFITERGGKYKTLWNYLIKALSMVSILMVLSNVFYEWMYCFDEYNIYHRLTGWYIYATVNSLAIFILFVSILLHKKYLSVKARVTLFVFFIAPLVGTVLQIFNLGISLIQVGTAIGTVCILLGYISEWVGEKRVQDEANEERKKFWIIECTFMIMILFVSAAVISCAVSVNSVANENSEQNSVSLAYMVSGTVESALLEPVNVSMTMAKSQTIIDALSADTLQGTENEKKMLDFMRRIKETYGYQMVFVASERNDAYYTYEGFSRHMDSAIGGKDEWYEEFRKRDIVYELNIDADKDNGMSLAVFVNMVVTGEDGERLGVCGVAMSIESLMELLSKFEEEYSLDITMVNPAGLVQLATDRDEIEKTFLDNKSFPNYNDDMVHYERMPSSARLVKYVNDLDWYLVLNDSNPDKLDVLQIVMPSIIIYIIGMALLLAMALIFGMRELRQNRLLRASIRLSETDGLTGLKNRYSMEKYFEEVDKKGMPEKLTVIMVDINGLKTVNDSIGHDAGDEMIKGAVDCVVSVFDGKAEIFRCGGDEFVITSTLSLAEIKGLINDLRKKEKEWHGDKVNELAFSLGFASNKAHPNCSIYDLLKLADDLMYRDKDEYYQKTGKVRRNK